MARKRVNAKGVQEGGFPLIPEGEYTAKIMEVVDGKSSSGDPMMSVKLYIPVQDNWLWDNIVISDNPNSSGYKILGRSMRFLHCIGEPYKNDFEYNTDNWLNKQVVIRVFHDMYNGKKKAKVAEYILQEPIEEQVAQNNEEEDPFA